MAAATENPQAAALDIANMNRVQKLAALLIILGPQNASKILKGFEEPDVTAITTAMATLPMIHQNLQRDILREFSDVAVQASSALRGGLEVAQNTLEQAVGAVNAREIMGRVAPRRAETSPMHQLVDKEARQIVNVVKTEQPQVIALVVSFLEPKKASGVLDLLSTDLRDQVIERLAMLGPTPIEVLETLGAMLVKKIGTTSTRAFNQTGGVEPAATVLKAMNREASNALLTALETRNPDLGKAIRNKMFTFEDLIKLDVASVQKLLREVDSRILATALKGASEKVRVKLFSGLSKRAAEAVEEEIGFLGKVKARDVEAAQMGIIETVRRLESDGEIELGEEEASGG